MIKYRLLFRDNADVGCRVDISNEDYTSDVIIPLRGVGENACTIDYESDTDDPYTPLVKSSASIQFYNQGQVDIDELQNSADKDFVVEVYRNEELYWKGFAIPEGIQKPMKAVPTITLQCTDGLSLLTDIPFTYADNLPGLTSDPVRCPMNYLRLVLFRPENLGIMLPIMWTNELQSTVFLDDVMTGQVTWSARGEGFASYQSDDPSSPQSGYVQKTCDYVLGGIVKSFGCRLAQVAGKWVMRRVNDITTGVFRSQQIAADYGIMVPVITEDYNINKVIGPTGYKFINEDQLTTVKPGIKSCTVTYDANIRENILPNGAQDFVNFGAPMYWGITNGSELSVDSIDGRTGSATDLVGSATPALNSVFTLASATGSLTVFNELPIDAYTLVKRLQFGFIFSPKFGFLVNTTTGFIDFSDNPLQIKLQYTMNGTTYNLDEFAIWREASPDLLISIQPDIPVAIGDVVSIEFNRNNSIIIPQPAAPSVPGANTPCTLKIEFWVRSGQEYIIDYIHFNIDSNDDIYRSELASTKNTATDERTLEISSSFGGYMLSNYMTHWAQSQGEAFFTDGDLYTGTLTGLLAAAIMRYRYKSSEIYNGSHLISTSKWTFDELYSIQTLTGKYLPLNASYNMETGVVNLVAMECRNDEISLTETHYGSNDSILSN